MTNKATKIEFLKRAARIGRGGERLEELRADSSYVAENIFVACEAMSLKLIRLVADMEFYGYVVRITPGGALLADDKVHDAAVAIDSGSTVTRLTGDPPMGAVSTKIYSGGPNISLRSLMAKNYAAEILRCVATGHIVVEDGSVRAADVAPGEYGFGSFPRRLPAPANAGRKRHVGMRRVG